MPGGRRRRSRLATDTGTVEVTILGVSHIFDGSDAKDRTALAFLWGIAKALNARGHCVSAARLSKASTEDKTSIFNRSLTSVGLRLKIDGSVSVDP